MSGTSRSGHGLMWLTTSRHRLLQKRYDVFSWFSLVLSLVYQQFHSTFLNSIVNYIRSCELVYLTTSTVALLKWVNNVQQTKPWTNYWYPSGKLDGIYESKVSVGDPSDRLRLVNLARQKVHEQNMQKIKHNGMGRFFALQDLQEHTKTPSEG